MGQVVDLGGCRAVAMPFNDLTLLERALATNSTVRVKHGHTHCVEWATQINTLISCRSTTSRCWSARLPPTAR